MREWGQVWGLGATVSLMNNKYSCTADCCALLQNAVIQTLSHTHTHTNPHIRTQEDTGNIPTGICWKSSLTTSCTDWHINDFYQNGWYTQDLWGLTKCLIAFVSCLQWNSFLDLGPDSEGCGYPILSKCWHTKNIYIYIDCYILSLCRKAHKLKLTSYQHKGKRPSHQRNQQHDELVNMRQALTTMMQLAVG